MFNPRTTLTVPIFLSRLHLRQQYHLKPGRGYALRKKERDEDDDANHDRVKRQNEEGYVHLMKSRGQHLLTNQRIIDTIVRKSDVRDTDTVLEIGPGTGNLTMKLLDVAQNVVAVEIDKRMVESLSKRVADSGFQHKLSVICKDALKTDFPHFDLVVANIPYGISSPFIAKLVFGRTPFRSATLLLQKEFARRLLANPGDSEFNRLAVNVKLVAEVDFIMDVSKRDFVPCPKVDSSVVIIRPKSRIPDVDMNEWWAFTRTCFCNKNKTLGATFKQKRKVIELMKLSMGRGSKEETCTQYECQEIGEVGDEEEDDGEYEEETSLFGKKIVAILKTNGFEAKRPSKLCNEELLTLLNLLNKDGIYFHDKTKEKNVELAGFAAAYSP